MIFIKNFLLIISFFSFLNAYSNLTLPKNVWRVSITKGSTNSNWRSSNGVNAYSNENFTFKNYGIKYFDHLNINSPDDLYDLGNLQITVTDNVEKIISDFNILSLKKDWGFQLSDFTENFFGPDSLLIQGEIYNSKSKFNYDKTSYNIEFGITNKTTFLISIPFYTKAEKTQFWGWNGTQFENGNIKKFLEYHTYNRYIFEELFISSIKDSIPIFMFNKMASIYNEYYEEFGDHSLIWALNSGEDPFGNIYDSNYNPFSDSIDSTSLDSILAYFYPKRTSSGLGDIKLGVNFHLFGSPVWIGESIFSIYAGLGLTIPSSKSLSKYQKNDLLIPNQFKELPLGNGLSSLDFSLFGEFYSSFYSRSVRMNWLIRSKLNSEGKFNTRVSPRGTFMVDSDSILFNLGDIYRMKRGNEIIGSINASIELLPKRLSFTLGQTWYYKNRDEFYSKNIFWNEWMAGGTDIHNGYDTKSLMINQKISLIFHNIYFSNQISSIPFELDFSLTLPVITYHNWHSLGLNLSFVSYFQFW